MAGVGRLQSLVGPPTNDRVGGKQTFSPRRSRVARQPYRELAELADLAVHSDAAAVLLGDDVIADRQPQPGTLTGRLGGEEPLEELIPDRGVITNRISERRDEELVLPYVDRVHATEG